MRAEHNVELKKYKKICNDKKNEYEQKQIEKLSELALDPGEFWKHWKRFDDNVSSEENKQVNGKKWEQYFAKLFDDPSRPNLEPNTPPSDQTSCSPINARYSLEE